MLTYKNILVRDDSFIKILSFYFIFNILMCSLFLINTNDVIISKGSLLYIIYMLLLYIHDT